MAASVDDAPLKRAPQRDLDHFLSRKTPAKKNIAYRTISTGYSVCTYLGRVEPGADSGAVREEGEGGSNGVFVEGGTGGTIRT